MRFPSFRLLVLPCLLSLVSATQPTDATGCGGGPGGAAVSTARFLSLAKQVCLIHEVPSCANNQESILQPVDTPQPTAPVLLSSILDASTNSIGRFLLAPLPPDATLETTRKRKCLVVDLDETLVHSSLEPIPDPDFVFPIHLNGMTHWAYVRKRPGAEYFLRYVAARFEVVVFTAGMDIYANPLLDILDPDRLISARLFRDSCVPYQHAHGHGHVKDLLHLGRPLQHTLIVDNSPISYLFQPHSAVPCKSWFSDRSDTELYEILPFLDLIAESDDVIDTIHQGRMSQKYSFFGPTDPNAAEVNGNKLFDTSLSGVRNWQQHQQLHQQQEAEKSKKKDTSKKKNNNKNNKKQQKQPKESSK